MSNHSNPNKKRKANDGWATTTDGAHDDVANTDNTDDSGSFLGCASPWPSQDGNNPSQLDRMENMMMRMEEKLATVGSTVRSLESRCEQLEARCSSLETTSHATQGHMDRSLRYHEMLIRNQKWEYSARVYARDILLRANYDADEADYIYETYHELKKDTEAMRRGDFPRTNNFQNMKEVSLCTNDEDHSFDHTDINNELSPHWREFAAALKQFKPAFDMLLPDDCETRITFGYVQLNREITELIQEALANIPFKTLSLEYTYRIHGGMSTIARIMKNNKYLQKLDMFEVQDMDGNDVAELSSAIHRHPSVMDVTIMDCFSYGGLGNEMLRTLLRTDELKIEKLNMPSNDISSVETTLLPDFLATNPRLKELDLTTNKFDDNDAALIANALRSNTTLRHLIISENCISEVGEEALRVAVRNESSLNSVADSNHNCIIESEDSINGNESDSRKINRARKIYALLSSRNETMSNVQHFGDIDVKLLPNILETVQKYSNTTYVFSNTTRVWESRVYVKALSIVYEVMRRWDKVSPLYKK